MYNDPYEDKDFYDIAQSLDKKKKVNTRDDKYNKKEMSKTLQPNSESIFQNLKGKILEKNTNLKNKPKYHSKK